MGTMPMRPKEGLWLGRRQLERRTGEVSRKALMRQRRCVPDAAPTSTEHVCVAAGSMGLALLQRALGL
jgi:hypothetical protein